MSLHRESLIETGALSPGKEDQRMGFRSNDVEFLIRKGFDLLLELRKHPDALRLLPLATACLETILKHGEGGTPPFVVSVKAILLRKQ
jgi:hypothetical protein